MSLKRVITHLIGRSLIGAGLCAMAFAQAGATGQISGRMTDAAVAALESSARRTLLESAARRRP